MKKQWQLNVILKMIATFCVIPLVFSTFFSGFTIISDGVQKNAPVEVSLFEYVSKGDLLLVFSFVCTVLLFILMVAIVVYSMFNVLKKENNKFIGVLLCVFELVLTIIAFLFVVIYCMKNTVKGIDFSLTYKLGASSIIYFICGLLFGIITLISYLINIKKQKRTTKKKSEAIKSEEKK